MGLQFWFAVLIRKSEFGAAAFEWLANHFAAFLKYSDKGAAVVFGSSYLDHRFVFEVRFLFVFCFVLFLKLPFKVMFVLLLQILVFCLFVVFSLQVCYYFGVTC